MCATTLDTIIGLIDGYDGSDPDAFRSRMVGNVSVALANEPVSIYVTDLLLVLPQEIDRFIAGVDEHGLDPETALLARQRLLATIEALRDELRLCIDERARRR